LGAVEHEKSQMNQSDWNRINGMLVESAISLLRAFGTSARYEPAGEQQHPAEDGMLAIIGFAGEQLRGSLVLSANPGLLEGSCPARTVGRADATHLEILQDWVGELANQLLGRLKSRLLAHGVAIELGTPTTVSGLELRVRSCGGAHPATPLWLHSGDDWLVVRLDAIAAPDTHLSASPDPSTAAAEGEILLF
jgi:CheY-specific phosphatase CheX